MEKKFLGLRRFNVFMACLHAAQGVAMLILSTGATFPVNASFLKFNASTASLAPNTTTLFNLKIAPVVATFLFLSAFFHLLVSLPGLNKIYNRNLGRHINFFRWIEYSLSSSIMIVLIAMLVGIYDIGTLIALIGVNASMILFGWMMELHNQSILRQVQDSHKTNWTAFYFGCIAGVVPWIVIGIYLFGPVDKAPTFVYWIFFSIFLFFNSFAINQALQYDKVGKWKDYLYGEKVYVILSLIAKSLLAWQVFAGSLRP